MIYVFGVILLLLAVWCIQDVIIKLLVLNSGVECYAQIEKFQEHRTSTVSPSEGDKIRYRAVLKYVDFRGQEHTVTSPKLYEKWETECLLGRPVAIRYYQRNPEKIVMEKKELIRPCIILALVLILPILYLIANIYVEQRFINNLLK